MAATKSQLVDALIENREARAELEQLVRRARSSGWSLREIAVVTGLSHETVRRITSPRP